MKNPAEAGLCLFRALIELPTYICNDFRRPNPARPSTAEPSNHAAAGSGTGSTLTSSNIGPTFPSRGVKNISDVELELATKLNV